MSRKKPSPEDLHYHNTVDPHLSGLNFYEIILGGQDGLVNVLGVILGVATASQDSRIILAAGLAATFAESVSMGAVAYTSALADAEHYESERQRELRHIERVPAIERQEVHDIFASKGFKGPILDKIVETIIADKETWVSLMLREDMGLEPIPRTKVLWNSAIVFVAALVGSFIPLMPFFFFSIRTSIWLSLGMSAISLFAVGAYKAYKMVGHPIRSGAELAFIGMVSALVGYVVGLFFQA